ncbi:MAG: restriction endonuclease subunit S [Candidatus Tectimicrobiota bacterium]
MRTGPFGSNLLHSEFTIEGDVAVLGIDNAVQNRFAWGERRFITNEKYRELESYRIYPGDVIVTIMGTIGRSAVIPDDIPIAINTKHLAAITLNKKIANPLFVSYSIHSSPFILNQFKSKNRGAIMSGLNLGLIKETKLKRPPIELQDRFAAIHKKIDEVKARYQQSLADLENLYAALSQKAFKGELDLSRVPLPTEGPEIAAEGKSDTEDKQPTEPLFALSAPVDLTDLQSAESRKTLLGQWLTAWLKQRGDAPFAAQPFIETARQRLWELAEDEAPDWSAAEYDELYAWVFEALGQGHLTQTYDDPNNRVLITAAQG